MKTVSTIALRRTSLSIYILFIITGVVIGSFIAKYTSLPSYVTVNQFFLLPKDGFNVFQLITGTFITSLCFVTAAFFFGLCVVGQPFSVQRHRHGDFRSSSLYDLRKSGDSNCSDNCTSEGCCFFIGNGCCRKRRYTVVLRSLFILLSQKRT